MSLPSVKSQGIYAASTLPFGPAVFGKLSICWRICFMSSWFQINTAIPIKPLLLMYWIWVSVNINCSSTEVKHKTRPRHTIRGTISHAIVSDKKWHAFFGVLVTPWSLYSKWRWEAFVQPRKPTHPIQSHTHTSQHYFLQVIAQGGRESGSVVSYMGLVEGRERENRGERGGLFDLLAASVWEAEWSRWAPITSPPTSSQPPTGHTHEYNRWLWIGPWLCFQGVVFEVNGSIRLCFLRSFSSRQQTPIKMFSIAQRALEYVAYNLAGV